MDSIAIIKFVSALIYPVGLIIVLFLLGWIGRLIFQGGLKRYLASLCYLLSFVFFLVFSNPQFATWIAKSLESQYPQVPLENIAKHDLVIVLGGGLRIPLPPAQHTQLSAGSDRYWYAMRLFKAGKASKIILSGGNVYKQHDFRGEAYYASQLMQEWGVPAAAIIIDAESRTTEQNRDNVMRLIEDNEYDSALLVTSALHMPRAYKLFRSLSIKVTPASADVIVREMDAPAVFSWMPSASAMALSTVALHEYYGKWFAELKAFISSA